MKNLVFLFLLFGILEINGYSQTTFGDYEYIVVNGKANITRYKGTDLLVNVPSEINGYEVYAIDEEAFAINPYPKIIFISEGIKKILWGAFTAAYGLEEIFLPESIEFIEWTAFSTCNNLKFININTNNNYYSTSNGILFNKNQTTIHSYPGGKTNQTYTIPSSVTTIGGWAFSGALTLRRINVPGTVLSTEEWPFSGALNLEKVFFFGNAPTNASPYLSSSMNDNYAKFYVLKGTEGWDISLPGTEIFTNSISEIFINPNEYNLYSDLQYKNNYIAGQQSILTNPNSNNLYTTNQIHNLGLGGIMLNRNTNNQLVLNYQILQSTDLQNWSHYQQYELPITNAPSDKMFLRVQAVGQ